MDLIFTNGPAVAGKSVLLCGQIMQLIQSDQNNLKLCYLDLLVQEIDFVKEGL